MDTTEVIKCILMGRYSYRIESPLIDALMAIICPQENDSRSDRALDISMNYEMDVGERADMLLGLREEVRGNYASDTG